MPEVGKGAFRSLPKPSRLGRRRRSSACVREGETTTTAVAAGDEERPGPEFLRGPERGPEQQQQPPLPPRNHGGQYVPGGR